METATREREEVADLTLTFDPADFWPVAESCPGWPVLDPRDPNPRMMGRAPAEERLRQIQATFSPRNPLRPPTSEEAARAKNDHFRQLDNPRVSTSERWYRLGFLGYGPRHENDTRVADTIVEALHIRGYLRKLGEQEVQREAQAARSEVARHQHSLEHYSTILPLRMKELDDLAPAIARHKQRLEDEAAVRRLSDIQSELRAAYFVARSAASTLNQEPPQAPELPE